MFKCDNGIFSGEMYAILNSIYGIVMFILYLYAIIWGHAVA
jgi:hypothetical protein